MKVSSMRITARPDVGDLFVSIFTDRGSFCMKWTTWFWIQEAITVLQPEEIAVTVSTI
jgi:hypothetical protein